MKKKNHDKASSIKPPQSMFEKQFSDEEFVIIQKKKKKKETRALGIMFQNMTKTL